MLNSIKRAFSAGNTYRNFLETIVREKKVWTLMRDGEYVLGESIGAQKVPFWSSREDAAACRFGGWADTQVELISLEDFVNVVLPSFQIQRLEIMLELKAGAGIYKPVPLIADSVRREARRQNVELNLVTEPYVDFEQGSVRYRNFIEAVLQNSEVWLLMREGASILARDENRDYIPLWGSQEDAEAAREGGWEHAGAEVCFLKDFLEDFIPEMQRDYPKAFVDVKDGEGIKVHFSELVNDLKAAAGEKGIRWDEYLPEQAKSRANDNAVYDFLKTFLEVKRVWFLHTETGLACFENEDGEWLPLYLSKEEAETECSGDWAEYETNPLSLADFLNHWVEDLAEDYDGAALSVGDGIVNVDFEILKEMVHIQAEEMNLKDEDLYLDNIEYLRFLWNIIRTGKVWILDDGDGFALLNVKGDAILPIWCCREDARADCSDEWELYDPESISLSDFLLEWISAAEKEQMKICVVGEPGKGMFLEPSDFKNDLEEELKKKMPDSLLLRKRTSINVKLPEGNMPSGLLN